MDNVKGSCKFFNTKKGFGFITVDMPGNPNHEKDIFAHQTAIKKEGFRCLNNGESCTFTITQTDKGLVAENVHGAGDGQPQQRPQNNMGGKGGFNGPPRGQFSPIRGGFGGQQQSRGQYGGFQQQGGFGGNPGFNQGFAQPGMQQYSGFPQQGYGQQF